MQQNPILEEFLAAPPSGTPSEVITVLGHALKSERSGLPARVFYEAVEQMALAISVTDMSGNILYVNAAFATVTGHVPAEVIGRNASMLSYKSTPQAVYQDLWKTIAAGRVWTGVILNRRKNGERYLADLTVVPLRDATGAISYYLGLHRDVTEHHELQRRAFNQKALIESVVDSAPVAMAFLDKDGRVAVDNHAYKCLMADLKGQEPAAQVVAAVAGTIGGTFAEARDRGRSFSNVEIRFDMPGRSEPRWFSCSGTWVQEADTAVDAFFDEHQRRGLLLVCHELTASRRQFEQARTNMVRALMAEQQMTASVREIIEAAIYQLQGPLNLVAAAIGVLDRQGDGTAALRDALTNALGDGNEALERLRQAIPKQVAEAVGPVNVNEIVRDALDVSTQRFLASGALVDWQPTPVLPAIPARATAMRTLVKSLIDNAVDALNEPGGHAREIHIVTGAHADGSVEITIEDTGPGIAEPLRRKVFEPFFTGWHNHRGHTGMGLTLAQQTVADQGGGIAIENGRSGGCRARVTFSPNVPAGEFG